MIVTTGVELPFCRCQVKSSAKSLHNCNVSPKLLMAVLRNEQAGFRKGRGCTDQIWHVLKPGTPKRNRRNETTGTTGTTGTAGTKPPEQPKQNHRNKRNEITGNTVKRSHISSAGSFRRHNFNSSPLPVRSR